MDNTSDSADNTSDSADNPPKYSPERSGVDRRKEQTRKEDIGPPPGVAERRKGDRRRGERRGE